MNDFNTSITPPRNIVEAKSEKGGLIGSFLCAAAFSETGKWHGKHIIHKDNSSFLAGLVNLVITLLEALPILGFIAVSIENQILKHKWSLEEKKGVPGRVDNLSTPIQKPANSGGLGEQKISKEIKETGILLPNKKSPFERFDITILNPTSENKTCSISSSEEMDKMAREIGEQLSTQHVQMTIFKPLPNEFIEELRKSTDLSEKNNSYIMIPKNKKESANNFTIRRYDNGVVEKVKSIREDLGPGDWEGIRTYPNGKYEEGEFSNFHLHKGISYSQKGLSEQEPIIYRLPRILASNKNNSLIEQNNKIIVVKKKQNNDYIEVVNKNPILTLIELLKTDGGVSSKTLNEILSGPIDCKEFINSLFQENSIFSIQPGPLLSLLTIIQKNNLHESLLQKYPEFTATLLGSHLDHKELVKILLSIDPSLIQRKEGKEMLFIPALLEGNREGAFLFLELMEEKKIELLPRELLFKKAAFTEEEMTLEEIATLSKKDQEIVYQLANSYSRLDIVRTMRTLGFDRKEELLLREGPGIFGCNMDALEMKECLDTFLKGLQSQKLLLKKTEFSKLPQENYIKKGQDIGRILGRDYIEKKAKELGLTHIKVPKKMIVINDDLENLKVRVDANLSIVAETQSNDFTVYAEKIERSDRKINKEEVTQLIRLFEATGFTDINWGNLIIAQDGVYIIDTEFTNFWLNTSYFTGGNQYIQMANIVRALPVDDQEELMPELEKKAKDWIDPKESKEQLEKQRAALEKTGCINGPSFGFLV